MENQAPALGFLEYLAEGVMILDSDRVIRAVNSALERMLGWSAAELYGVSCQQIFGCQHPITTTSLCSNLCPLLALRVGENLGEPVHYQEISVATRSGERREVSASFATLELPVINPGEDSNKARGQEAKADFAALTPPYSIVVFRDISEQKRQERIKAEFIATASHQLRTPLSSIKTSIGILLDSVGEDFRPPLMRLLRNIQVSSMRMERLVSDLIELTNLQSGRVQMQRHHLEVSKLVEKAVELSKERLQARQQELTLDLPKDTYYVEADYSRISQVLGHLLSNASKFSPAGSPIVLQVTPADQLEDRKSQRNEVVFSVRDEGIGIAPEEQTLIFEKFYQSQVEENTSEIGTGMGLALAKALVELNGGHLWLQSELGKGSTFYFTLPAVV